MTSGLVQMLRHARPFAVTDPNGGWRCRVIKLRGDRDGTVRVTAWTPIPLDRPAYPVITVTATGAHPLERGMDRARDRRLSVALAEALTDPAQATHLAAAAQRLERTRHRSNRTRGQRPGDDTATGTRARDDDEVRVASVLLAALASPPEVLAVTLTLLAADPDTDPHELLTAARAAAS